MVGSILALTLAKEDLLVLQEGTTLGTAMGGLHRRFLPYWWFQGSPRQKRCASPIDQPSDIIHVFHLTLRKSNFMGLAQ